MTLTLLSFIAFITATVIGVIALAWEAGIKRGKRTTRPLKFPKHDEFERRRRDNLLLRIEQQEFRESQERLATTVASPSGRSLTARKRAHGPA